MRQVLYRDPTFEAVAAMEIRGRGCRVCKWRVGLSKGAVVCGVGERFPKCRTIKKGFVLDEPA